MAVADVIGPLVRAAFGAEAPVAVECWDGSRVGGPDAPLQLIVGNRRALRRMLYAPNELGFARAYVSGDLDVRGELVAGLDALEQVSDPDRGVGVTVDAATKRALLKAVLRLGVVGAPPRPPAEEFPRRRGRRHTKARDVSAVSHHYDVGNDFYRIVLGESMTYSCAYWPPSADDLTAAQYAKCDLVARKLGLRPGLRVLDVGCGWGTFAMYAAREFDVEVVGITLSGEQADFAREQCREQGLAGRVDIRVQDYRDITDGPFDAISSIGMAEHVGATMLPVYASDLFDLLPSEGRLLNHAISRRPGAPPEFSPTSFIDRYVFPDGELVPLAVMIEALENAGFEVRDVESLREHYGRTLRAWVANLERDWDRAVALTSGGRARIWRLYMAGSALAFEANRIGVNQVLAVKPSRAGASGMPTTRAGFVSDGSRQTSVGPATR